MVGDHSGGTAIDQPPCEALQVGRRQVLVLDAAMEDRDHRVSGIALILDGLLQADGSRLAA